MSQAIPVVYDCIIFLQAAARADRLHKTMQFVHDGTVRLFVSPDVIAELQDVLARPEITAKFPALSRQHVDVFLNDLLSRAAMVKDVPLAFTLPRDKKDESYLNLAIEAKVQYLVTWNNRHLTYLMKHDTPEGVEFCRRFPSLRIVDPPMFLDEIRRLAAGSGA
jgi:putative PIN family toxin of toxin-antitoxin system